MPTYIDITAATCASLHICCAIGDDAENSARADSKRAWMAGRFAEGLVFRRLDARGKVFIEYLPIEAAWKPVEGAGQIMINCLWVSGQYKGQGHGERLLESCVADARSRGLAGVAAVSASRKRPFLTDKSFYTAHGFETVDSAKPGYELLYLAIDTARPAPRFSTRARAGTGGPERGLGFVWCAQCPFMESVVAEMAAAAQERGLPVTSRRLESAAQAQAEGSPFGTLGIYWNGFLREHQPMAPKAFAAFLDGLA